MFIFFPCVYTLLIPAINSRFEDRNLLTQTIIQRQVGQNWVKTTIHKWLATCHIHCYPDSNFCLDKNCLHSVNLTLITRLQKDWEKNGESTLHYVLRVALEYKGAKSWQKQGNYSLRRPPKLIIPQTVIRH